MNLYEKLADPFALAAFVLTLLLPVGVGWYALRRTQNQSDFFVGGRGMRMLVVALSAVSSGRSSWLVLGVSGLAYVQGVAAIWAIVGYTVVECVQFVTIGPRLRRAADDYDAVTLFDYFAGRFPARARLLRVVGAAIAITFLTAYVSAQLSAGAKTLASALDWSVGSALASSAGLLFAYMLLGGYVAVAYNDVVRAFIILIGLLVLPAVALIELGGLGALTTTLRALEPALCDVTSLSFGVALGFVGIGLGSPGQPHILVRYMSIADVSKLRLAAFWGTLWNVLLGVGAVMIGLVGRALVPEITDLPNADQETIYLVLSAQHFSSLTYGLLVGGVFAAILSTADSQLLVVASTFVHDLWKGVLGHGRARPAQGSSAADERSAQRLELRLSRAVVLGSGLVAVLLAWRAESLILQLVLFAWAGLGAAFGPAVIAALFWRRATGVGVASGMIAGAALAVIFQQRRSVDSERIYELVPAFFGALATIAVVSIAERWFAARSLDKH